MQRTTVDVVIIILGFPVVDCNRAGPVLESRLLAAFNLYKSCQSAYLVVSGGVTGASCTEANVMKEYLLRQGVNPYHILLEENAQNTYENAMLTAGVIKPLTYRSLVIVTSDFHKYRVSKYFSLVYDKFEIVTADIPHDYPQFKKAVLIMKEGIAILLFKLGLLNRAKKSKDEQG